jgi:hypothetical protein
MRSASRTRAAKGRQLVIERTDGFVLDDREMTEPRSEQDAPIVSGQIGYLRLHVTQPHDRRADRHRKAYTACVPTLILYFALGALAVKAITALFAHWAFHIGGVSGPTLYFLGVSFRTSK